MKGLSESVFLERPAFEESEVTDNDGGVRMDITVYEVPSESKASRKFVSIVIR